MAEPVIPTPPMSIEQYLEFEQDALVRHEYIDGQLHAMTGASKRHNLIAINILRKLVAVAQGTSCQVFMSDVKVRTPGNVVYYPDLMVVCDPDSNDPYVASNPCLIVEVVSPTTGLKDRREKLAAYKTIPSLKAYLIVDQDRQQVEHHYRDKDGEWLHTTLIGGNTVPVPCPGTELSLTDIYEGL